jgi:UDP-N-acetylmuramate dehydrogenase|tara:strand:- start:187 stop:1104 length:918 start_codon:yes stop_codon:yes gene_type:complete
MKIDDLEKIKFVDNSRINFDYDLSRLNWFNIGGKSKIYLLANSLYDLSLFLKKYDQRGKIFVLGAGSNTLFGDDIFEGVVIKLGKNFNNISKLKENFIISGSSCLDKKVAEFAMENEIQGFEFLSCIPGSIGGGIKMNAGCYGKEFKDIIVSVQAIDFYGKVLTIPASNISFNYRSTDLSKNLIFLSGTFKGTMSSKEKIKLKIEDLKNKKELTQPQRVKTSGSTFKNPVNQTNKKVWELIKESIDIKEANKMFGDATLSEKHCNFLINKEKASSKDMKNLINFIKENVYKKTGVNLELEIVLTS